MTSSLVLLPGLDGTGELFDPFLQELTPHLNPLVLRYSTQGPQDYASLVRFVLGELPSDRKFVLLGESFSGPVAVMAAAEKPDNLAGIILSASFVKTPRRIVGVLAQLSKVAPLHLLSRVGGPYLMMGRFRTPNLTTSLSQAIASIPRRVLCERCGAVAGIDVRTKLRDLAVPALYLRASEDAVVPVSAAEIFSASSVAARVEVIEAPHFLLQCAPEASARAVEQFVRAVCSDV